MAAEKLVVILRVMLYILCIRTDVRYKWHEKTERGNYNMKKALVEINGMQTKVLFIGTEDEVAKLLAIWYNKTVKGTSKIDWKYTDYSDENGYASVSNWETRVEMRVAEIVDG